MANVLISILTLVLAGCATSGPTILVALEDATILCHSKSFPWCQSRLAITQLIACTRLPTPPLWLSRLPTQNMLRNCGGRTRYLETMYILDLALDHRSADLPTRAVPWGRFKQPLKDLNLE